MSTTLSPPSATDTDFVRAHQAGLWRYVRFLGADDAGAEDLVQETFLAVLRHPPEDRGPAATWAYLRTVARNQFLANLRRRGREVCVQELDLIEQVWRETDRDDGGAARLTALRGCLDQLTGRARQAIEMRYRDNASREQLATALELSLDGVKSLLRRTRDVLRNCVQKQFSPDD